MHTALITHSSSVLRQICGVATLTLFAIAASTVAGAPARADHSCYPDTCNQGDAKLTGIAAPPQMFQGRKQFVRVDGSNVGAASRVVTKLRSSNGSVRPLQETAFHVGADQTYSVYFKVRPSSAGRARFKACTAARRVDENRSNNCGSVKVRVLRR